MMIDILVFICALIIVVLIAPVLFFLVSKYLIWLDKIYFDKYLPWLRKKGWFL